MSKMVDRFKVLYKYRSLFYELVMRDIKQKYRRSYLGYLWSVLNPLLLMIVLAAVFTQMFHRTIPYYPAYLISGQVLFNFMTESTREAMTSVLNNASLLKKTYVPKYIFTLSRVTSTLITLLLSLVALLIVFIATGVPLTAYMLMFWFPILQLYIFCVGLGLFLAQAVVFFRDIQYIYSVVTTAWMYLTPIFYNVEILPDWLLFAVKHFNPMYCYLMQFRCLLLEGCFASFQMTLAGFAWAFIMVLLGTLTFLRSKDKFILYI